jgi:putative membrane protein
MSSLAQLILRWGILAVGVVLATKLVPGIKCDDGATLLAVVLLLSFCNAILKPILVLFTLPFILLTMGLGVILINALLFLFVGRLIDGFHVQSFGSAVWGALIVSITNLLLSGFAKRAPVKPSAAPSALARREKRDDVIDI